MGTFHAEDAVHIWSASKGRWVEDGRVQTVASSDMSREEGWVAKNSILVIYDSGECWKWVQPWEQLQLVRRAAPQGGGQGALVQGDMLQVLSLTQGCWFSDGLVRDVAGRDMVEGGMPVPKGSVLVTYRNGEGVKWVAPHEQELVLRKAQDSSSSSRSNADTKGTRCLLIGAHGGCLAVTSACELGMATDGQGFPWTLVPVGEGEQLLLVAPGGLCLSARDAGEQAFCLTDGAGPYAVWTPVEAGDAGDAFFLMSAYGTFLASLNDRKQTLYMSPNQQDWEKWRFAPLPAATAAASDGAAGSAGGKVDRGERPPLSEDDE